MDSQTTLHGEVAELGVAIDREVAGIVVALSERAPALGDENPAGQLTECQELVRQLGALRARVAQAGAQIGDPRALRAELATLLFFATTLRSDAERLGERRREALEQLAREQRAACLESERLVAEREDALRRRDALQAKIVQTAERLTDGDRSDCRRTVPVITLGEGVTVCSVAVRSPKRRFRFRYFWLVTLTDARDGVLVIRT